MNNTENSVIPDTRSHARTVAFGRESGGPSVLAVSIYFVFPNKKSFLKYLCHRV